VACFSVRLLGRFGGECEGKVVAGPRAGKARELLAYLLVHRGRAHTREALAAVLWPDGSPAQSKKYLRQALWQLQAAFKEIEEAGCRPPVFADAEWVQLDTSFWWIDVAEFEGVCERRRGLGGADLDADGVAALDRAVELYRGELLEGWYFDWCTLERERLRGLYLSALDKLLEHSESRGDIEAGLRYGELSLRTDPAREGVHQGLMRLHIRAGNRAEALRQYDRCVLALEAELGVEPSRETADLHRQVRDNAGVRPAPLSRGAASTLNDVLARLRCLESALSEMKGQIRDEIEVVETALESSRGPAGRQPLRRAG